ncbi:hypothetical protein H098_08065 [Pseudomonas fluorescens FH5]|nr:hypothetical protein H098_08065 [Pseudomonas fluorescens FH5]
MMLLDQKLPVWLPHLHQNQWLGDFCTSLKKLKELVPASETRESGLLAKYPPGGIEGGGDTAD